VLTMRSRGVEPVPPTRRRAAL